MSGEESFDVKLNALITDKRELSKNLLMPLVSETDTADLYSSILGEGGPSVSSSSIVEDIKKEDGVSFENRVLREFKNLGFTAETTPVTGDGGVDGVISKDNKKFHIQCKQTSLISKPLQHLDLEKEYKRARQSYNDLENYIVFTNAKSYPKKTILFAKNNNIKLFTYNDLLSFQDISHQIMLMQNSNVKR